MKLSEILIAYRNKINELKEKYAEDLKVNNLENLSKDPDYDKYMTEFSSFCKFAFDKMSITEEDDAKRIFGQNKFKVLDRKGNEVEINVATPTKSIAFKNIDKYAEAILNNKEVVDKLNEEISQGKIYTDLSLVGIKSRYSIVEKDYKDKLKQAEDNKEKDLSVADNLGNLNTAFSYSANRCSEYEKKYRQSNALVDKNVAVKYAGYLLEMTNIAANKINSLPTMKEGMSNFEYLIDQEITKSDYKISEKDLADLKSLNHKSAIAKHRNLLNNVFNEKVVSDLFKDENILENEHLAELKYDANQIKIGAEKRYNEELNKIERDKKTSIDTIDRQVFPELNEDFNPDNGVDNIQIENHHKYIDNLERLDERVTANSYKQDYKNFMIQNGKNEGIEGVELSNERDAQIVEINDEMSWGDDVVTEHQNRVNEILNSEDGVSINNSDKVIREIATIKAKHNARPWYQKFFGYFGRIGKELNEADRLAEEVATRLNVEAKLVKDAVDETANITIRTANSKSKNYILKEQLLKLDNLNNKKDINVNKEEIENKKDINDLDEVKENKVIDDDFIKGIDELGNENDVNVLDDEIKNIDDNYDFSLDYEKDSDFIAYDKMQTEEFKESDKEHKNIYFNGVLHKLDKVVKYLNDEDGMIDFKAKVEMNKKFDEFYDGVENRVGDYKEKKELEITEKFNYDIQKEVGEAFKPSDQKSLNESLIQSLDEGNSKVSKVQNIENNAPNKDLNKN